MKRLKSYYMNLRHPQPQTMERKWLFPLAIGSIVSLFLLFLSTLTSPDGSPFLPFYRSITASNSVFVESKLHVIPTPSTLPPPPEPPRLAYLISGSNGDGKMLRRTLLALYHPRNRYVVHLDLESSPQERSDLYRFVSDHPVFARFGNVKMITKANLVTYRGPTMVANTLHAAAILLREGPDWDWFINLSASDYPLVTQDGTKRCRFVIPLFFEIPYSFDWYLLFLIGLLDLLHTFSYLPRDLNFIDHTSNIGWKE
jgi:hypothetical protein